MQGAKNIRDISEKAKDICSKFKRRNHGGLKCKFIHIQKPGKNSLWSLKKQKEQEKY
jgi:hypothetical protein